MKKLTKAVLCLAVIAAATPAAAKRDTAQYSSVTVFGDSLVDAGNIFSLTGGGTPSAANGYFNGRFTNGYDYTDLLSIALYGTPTVASRNGGTNFAFGGARATTTSAVPDLNEQLGLFNAYLAGGKTVDRNGLYVLTFGGNDIFAAQTAAAGGTSPPGYASIDAYLLDAATRFAGGVKALNDLGARNFLLTDFPVASPYSLTANAYLTSQLGALTLSNDATLFRYNSLDFFGRVTANPGAFGIGPFTQAGSCQSGGAAAIIGGCLGYFSFDGTHPVAAVQKALFQDIDSQFQLTAVPEPATWLMLIGGFGLAGAALRRRRAAPAIPAIG